MRLHARFRYFHLQLFPHQLYCRAHWLSTMSSSGYATFSCTFNAERLSCARPSRQANVVTRASPTDGPSWGKQRDPIEDAKQFVYSSTKKVKSRITQSADEIGTKCGRPLVHIVLMPGHMSPSKAVQHSPIDHTAFAWYQ